MELDKLKELILSRLFFILGALLILIGVGYTLAEKLKDNPIILSIIIFLLSLPFIALPYKYKSKLSNFFFIGFQVIGLSILYLDTILSAVVFNIIPLTYSLIIIFLISLLGIALSIINKSNELMILSTIGVYFYIWIISTKDKKDRSGKGRERSGVGLGRLFLNCFLILI